MAQNLISAIAWVSRGYAMRQPKNFELDEDDMQQMKQDPRVRKNLSTDLSKIQEQEEESSMEENYLPVFCQDLEYHGKQQVPDDNYPLAIEDLSDEEKEDYQIKNTDALIVAAKIENEFSSLEIYIYEEEKANLFVHHELQLSAFPLAVEWLPIHPSGIETTAHKGNYAIVASFLPEIEIWNLDVVNVLEPSLILGGEIETNYKKVKNLKKTNRKFKQDSHTDSVISLSLNRFKPNILLSGSADTTAKLWDIAQNKCVFTYTHHKDKIQISKFNTKEESVFLTASEDSKLSLLDARSPQALHTHKLLGSIEGACWDPIKGYHIVYSTEEGDVVVLDARKITDKPLAHFNVHKKAVSSVSMSSDISGLLSTTCLDGKIRVYDLDGSIKNGHLPLISSYNPKLDSLYCGQFYQDSPWTFACGSEKGELFVWDMMESEQIVSHFLSRLPVDKRPNLEECNRNLQEDLCMKERVQQEQIEQEDQEEQAENQEEIV